MGIAKRYGYCICHNTMSSLNAKGLCPIGAKERQERVAKSKGIITKNARNVENLAKHKEFTIKKKDDGIDITRRREADIRGIQGVSKWDTNPQKTIPIQKPFAFKKTKIKPRSDKNKELVKQELLMFEKIWEIRPHFCEVTGKPIHTFDIRCFSHILTKGAYGRFRLYEKNIVFCLPEKHFEWEFGTRKKPEFEWIEKLELELKREYYEKSSNIS